MHATSNSPSMSEDEKTFQHTKERRYKTDINMIIINNDCDEDFDKEIILDRELFFNIFTIFSMPLKT